MSAHRDDGNDKPGSTLTIKWVHLTGAETPLVENLSILAQSSKAFMTPHWVTWAGLVHHLSLFLYAPNSSSFPKLIPLSPVTMVLHTALEHLWAFISPSQKFFFEHQIDWYLCSPWLSFHRLLVKSMTTLTVMVPTYNSSYSGGWGRRITNSNQVNVSKYDQDQLGKFSENLPQIFKINQKRVKG